MIPKSISASSLLVSEACEARWRVENFARTPQPDSVPAMIGTSCHYALEQFVKGVYIDKTLEWSDVKQLDAYYKIGYTDTFRSANFDTDEFRDGAKLVADWYDRNRDGLPDQVLSVEIKETFPVGSSAGDIPFTYIWDRCDQIGEDEYHVVDYKTLRAIVRPEDLKQKIQPRAYALAAQIKWPNAKRIWVSFDMLRHDGLVGVSFTREENIATYRMIQRALKRILKFDESAEPTETINDECKWCIRKTECETLLKANAGGVPLGMPLERAAAMKLQVQQQLVALKYADEALDKVLLKEAEEQDLLEFVVNGLEIVIGARKQRKANSSAITEIVGPELTARYGNFTVTNVDKMLKNEDLDPDMVTKIKREIQSTYGQPSARVKTGDMF